MKKENSIYIVSQVIPVLHFQFNLYIPIGTALMPVGDDEWYKDATGNYWVKEKFILDNLSMFYPPEYNKYANLPDEILKLFIHSFRELDKYEDLTKEEQKFIDRHDFRAIKTIIGLKTGIMPIGEMA